MGASVNSQMDLYGISQGEALVCQRIKVGSERMWNNSGSEKFINPLDISITLPSKISDIKQ